jgi:beta-glucosidase
VAPPLGDLYRPVKELKAFTKIRLEPGQTAAVTLVLDDRSFACWDPGSSETTAVRARMPLGSMINEASGPDSPPGWRIDPGSYVLHVGRSSADIAWTVPVTVTP